MMIAAPEQEKQKGLLVRIPPILHARITGAVAERKKEYPKFSLNDWVLEAMREKLDGVATPVVVTRALTSPSATVEVRTTQAFGRSVDEFLAGKGAVVNVGNAPVESVPSHRAGINRLAGMWQQDPSAVDEGLKVLLMGDVPPAKFGQWHSNPKVKAEFITWMDTEHPIEEPF